MGHQATYITLDERELRLGPRGGKLGLLLALVGFGLVVAGVLLGGFAMGEGGFTHVMRAYLIGYAFILSIAVGALFFVMIHHLTRAGWSTTVRRWAECVTMTFPGLLLLAIPIVAAAWAGVLYPWTHNLGSHSPVLEKTGFLNLPFFTVRLVVYFAIFIGLSWLLYRRSTQQDTTGDWRESSRMGALSAPGMLVFALVTTLFSMDLLMTLEPEWFSTIWGVYFFGGSMVGFFAFMILSLAALQQTGHLTQAVTREHYHDLGKLMFAFVIFWAYIAFSQFMLQWYANIPEETVFYQRRGSDHLMGTPAEQWLVLSYVLMAGHFFIPLLGFISRWFKRRKAFAAFWAVWLLVFHWLDLYWIVTPAVLYHHGGRRKDVIGTIDQGIPVAQLPLDLVLMAGLGLLFVGGVLMIARRQALVPTRDPRLQESLHFHQPF